MAARILPKFQVDFTERQWKTWRDLVKSYILTQGVTHPDIELVHLMTQGGETIVDLLRTLPDRNPPGVGVSVSMIERNEFTRALEKLDDFFESKETPFMAVCEFREMKPCSNEPMKKFRVRV